LTARYGALWGIIAICTVIELVLSGADLGILGSQTMRFQVFMVAAFWDGYLTQWPAQYPMHPLAMFVTHAFLHANFLHLVVNMASLAGLGKVVISMIGQRRFLALYLMSAIGGGAGFALISDIDAPMVGASGALFGLLGLLVGHEIKIALAQKSTLLPAIRTIGVLILLNVVLWWATAGHLAWQAHLGGAIIGLAWAFFALGQSKHRAQRS